MVPFVWCPNSWSTAMKILMVLTSHGQLGETGKATGLWLEELAAPYYVFKDAGADITLASPAGGQPPVDPNSEPPGPGNPEGLRRPDQTAHRVSGSRPGSLRPRSATPVAPDRPSWHLGPR